MLNFDITAASRTGLVRENNEDMIVVGEWFVRDGKMRTHFSTKNVERYLLALADGMGGHNSGEVASSEALHNLQFFFNDIPGGLPSSEFNELIFEWLQSVNAIFVSKGHVDQRLRDMGTTLVSLVYYHGEFYWMNCGDSRLYRLHDGHLTLLTTDHSLNNLYGDPQHSNYITNCIGGGCKTSFIDITVCTDSICDGDTFLLCSDGLNDMLPDSEIERLLLEGSDADSLCAAADSVGGFDNVSACVIKVQEIKE